MHNLNNQTELVIIMEKNHCAHYPGGNDEASLEVTSDGTSATLTMRCYADECERNFAKEELKNLIEVLHKIYDAL